MRKTQREAWHSEGFNICVVGVPEKNGAEAESVAETVAENFPKLIKGINTQFQEAYTQSRMKTKIK